MTREEQLAYWRERDEAARREHPRLRELESGDYPPGPYHAFTIWEPKERHIAAAE